MYSPEREFGKAERRPSASAHLQIIIALPVTVPHNENPDNTTGQGDGRSTTWTVKFDLPKAPTGTAMLRLAICGVIGEPPA